MIGYSKIHSIIAEILATGLVNKFYHSVELVDNVSGGVQPKALVQGDWDYVGPDDTKGFFGYIRNTTGIESVEPLRDSSCGKGYTAILPHRIVFFNDYERRSHTDLVGKLLAFTFLSGVSLKKVLLNKRQILSQEAPDNKFTFREDTFYFAIDFVIKIPLTADSCGSEIQCISERNPICS